MENYRKGKNVEEELTQDQIPIDILPEKFLWMHVKGGTKVSNVVEFVEKAFQSGEHRSVVWTGSSGGVPKTISCAEITKRNFNVNQVTQLSYQKIEEYWDPIVQGLDQIIVSRQIPSIHIFLTLDEIDTSTKGYQKQGSTSAFWPEPSSKLQSRDIDYVHKNRQGGNGNRNRNGSNQKTRPTVKKATNQ